MGENETEKGEELSYQEKSDDSDQAELEDEESKSEIDTHEIVEEPSIEALKYAFENSVHEIDRQLDVLSGLEKRSLKLAQATLVFIGLLATGASLTEPSTLTERVIESPTCAVGTSPRCLTSDQLATTTFFSSFVGLLILLVFAAPEKTGRNRRTTQKDLDYLLTNDISEREYLNYKLEKYKERIKTNRSGIRSKSWVITVSLFS